MAREIIKQHMEILENIHRKLNRIEAYIPQKQSAAYSERVQYRIQVEPNYELLPMQNTKEILKDHDEMIQRYEVQLENIEKQLNLNFEDMNSVKNNMYKNAQITNQQKTHFNDQYDRAQQILKKCEYIESQKIKESALSFLKKDALYISYSLIFIACILISSRFVFEQLL